MYEIMCCSYRLWTVRTVYGLFVPSMDCSYRLWSVRTVYGLFVPSMDCSYRLWTVRAVYGLFVPSMDCSYRLWTVRTVYGLFVPSMVCSSHMYIQYFSTSCLVLLGYAVIVVKVTNRKLRSTISSRQPSHYLCIAANGSYVHISFGTSSAFYVTYLAPNATGLCPWTLQPLYG
jgi:hypothetical protein